MGIFDEAKKLGGAALTKGKEFGGVALEKGKNLAQITKLNLDITAIETKISDAKKNIGDIVIKNKIKISDENITKEIDNIKNMLAEIENIKAKVAEIETKTNNL